MRRHPSDGVHGEIGMQGAPAMGALEVDRLDAQDDEMNLRVQEAPGGRRGQDADGRLGHASGHRDPADEGGLDRCGEGGGVLEADRDDEALGVGAGVARGTGAGQERGRARGGGVGVGRAGGAHRGREGGAVCAEGATDARGGGRRGDCRGVLSCATERSAGCTETARRGVAARRTATAYSGRDSRNRRGVLSC